MDQVLKYAIESEAGLIAVLYVALLGITGALVKWVLQTNNERERRYIQVINDQAEALRNVDDIRKTVKSIEKQIYNRRDR